MEQEERLAKFWKVLAIIAFILMSGVFSTSDQGLDSHLRENAENEDGELTWGKVRTEDPLASNPLESGLFSLSYLDFNKIIFASGFLLFIIASVLALVNSYKIEKVLFCVIFLHPQLILSNSMGYSEVGLIFISTFPLLLIYSIRSSKSSTNETVLYFGLFWVIMLSVIAGVKSPSLAAPTFWIVSHFAIVVHFLPSGRKLAVLCFFGSVVLLLILGLIGNSISLGLIGNSTTLAVISSEPVFFFKSLIVSFFDVIILYLLVGFVFWPFVLDVWRNLDADSSWEFKFALGIFAGMLGAIWVYVAALWTYEATLWDASAFEIWIALGKNGRYVTFLAPFFLFLMYRIHLARPEVETLWNPGSKSKALVIGILVILPVSLIAGLHGQQNWTEEPALILEDELANGEEFLMIADQTLAMHWLYSIKTYVDLDGEKNITGHWRAPDSGFESELDGVQIENRGDLSNVTYILVGPGVDVELSSHWELIDEGQGSFLSRGGDWQLFQHYYM